MPWKKLILPILALPGGAYVAGFELTTFGEDQAKQAPSSHHEDVPHVVPKEPNEAAKTFHVPDGFHMDLIAQEPLITSPVAMTYDENGNMYVAEMVDFPFPEKAPDHPHGRVRLLRDNDGAVSYT